MGIAVLATGHVGSALGTAWSRKGHEVFWGMREPPAAAQGRQSGTRAEAAAFGEVIVLALRWSASLTPLDLTHKIVIDCTNPPGLRGSDGESISGAEAIAARVPAPRVAKCWDITGANNMADPAYPGGPMAMFACSDDVHARAAALQLAAEVGFDAYDLGPLANAPHGVVGANLDLVGVSLSRMD
jgi:predicted dinucleotide-binding enzyme